MTPYTDSQKTALAHAFADTLRLWLRLDEFEEMVALNAAETDPMICHSHDFCDANQAMLDAFEATFGREVLLSEEGEEAQVQADWAVLDAAWTEAKAAGFYFEVQP